MSEGECILLTKIVEEGDCGTPKGMSSNRRDLASMRIYEKGLIEENQDGTYPTRLALEWLEKQNILK